MINATNMSSGEFIETQPGTFSEDITILNCRIKCIRSKVTEVVAISTVILSVPQPVPQTDVAGLVYPILKNSVNKNGQYLYKGNVLSDIILTLTHSKDLMDPAGGNYGALSVNVDLYQWSIASGAYFTITNNMVQFFLPGNITISPNMYKLFCDGDAMFNVLKGVMGIRADGVKNLVITKASICDIVNKGGNGSLICGPYTASNPNQGIMVGYTGGLARGIIISGSKGVDMDCVKIAEISSSASSATGLTIQNGTTGTNISKLNIHDVEANADNKYDDKNGVLPNQPPVERDIYLP
jgi:hypothetical protein